MERVKVRVPSLETIRQRIRAAGADPDAVRVVAVAKGFDSEVARAAVGAGFIDLGENRAGPLLDKARALADLGVRWHFVGAVQRNKVGALAPHVTLWHGVDRLEEGRAIAAHRPGSAVLVQVNTTGEPQKAGCSPAATRALVEDLRRLDLDIQGLMTVGPIGPAEAARPAFRRLAALRADLGLAELSMGMSGDLEVAVEEGATIVRIGTALFGPRPQT
jgi:hypothetical protein